MSFLEKIIEPVLIDDFINNSWNQSFLKVEGYKEKFKDIFDLITFKKLLEENSLFLSYPQITLFQNGQRISENLYSKKWKLRSSAVLGYQERTSIDLNKINSLIQAGVTIKLSQLDSIFSPIVENLNHFSDELNPELIYVNILYSTKATQGYKPHFDEHDVFVLQLHGEKVWEILNIYQNNPLQEYRGEYLDDEYMKAGKEILELKQGDCLYVPRGLWHNVYSTSEPSLHLQIGIRAKTPIDLIYWIQEKLIHKKEFRESILNTHKIDNKTKQLIINSIMSILEDEKVMESFFKNTKANLPNKTKLDIL